MKVVLAFGSRNWGDVGAVERWFNSRHWEGGDIVLHGGCRGADTIIDSIAKRYGIHTLRMDALWRTHGDKAGPARNTMMRSLLGSLALDREIVAVGFWDGESPGTKGMIEGLERLRGNLEEEFEIEVVKPRERV